MLLVLIYITFKFLTPYSQNVAQKITNIFDDKLLVKIITYDYIYHTLGSNNE